MAGACCNGSACQRARGQVGGRHAAGALAAQVCDCAVRSTAPQGLPSAGAQRQQHTAQQLEAARGVRGAAVAGQGRLGAAALGAPLGPARARARTPLGVGQRRHAAPRHLRGRGVAQGQRGGGPPARRQPGRHSRVEGVVDPPRCRRQAAAPRPRPRSAANAAQGQSGGCQSARGGQGPARGCCRSSCQGQGGGHRRGAAQERR
mmetsp:Transcript_49273/g.100618  ORF Transcript_49273/g.100618 Transcript_49273/m.100618 type:complete len:204 (-) Transcript_49273:165-776(-)